MEIAENKGKIIVLSTVLVFAVVIGVIQPEPIPTMSRQILMSVRMYDWGYEILDENGDILEGDRIIWSQLPYNETVTKTLFGVRNTGTFNITLKVSIIGAKPVEPRIENLTIGNETIRVHNFDQWMVGYDECRIIYSYHNQTIAPNETFWLTFYVLTMSKEVDFRIDIKAIEVKEE